MIRGLAVISSHEVRADEARKCCLDRANLLHLLLVEEHVVKVLKVLPASSLHACLQSKVDEDIDEEWEAAGSGAEL